MCIRDRNDTLDTFVALGFLKKNFSNAAIALFDTNDTLTKIIFGKLIFEKWNLNDADITNETFASNAIFN